MSRHSSLNTSSTRSLISKFDVNEPLMDMTLKNPRPHQGQFIHHSLFGITQDSCVRGGNGAGSPRYSRCGSDSPCSFHDRVENSLYGSQIPRPPPKCSLDISADTYLTHDGPSAPPNPHNTPASNSEQASHGSSEAGSCHGQSEQDIHDASESKAEDLNLGWPNESQILYDEYWVQGDEKERRKRQLKSSITDTEYGVFSHGLDPLDHVRSFEAEELAGTTPPFMRSPQFSPPGSFKFRPPRIRFLRQHSWTRRAEYPSAERQKRSLGPPKSSRRRHIHRLYPYRSPPRPFHMPMEQTDRFQIPLTSILKFPFRRESPAGQSIHSSIESRTNKNIKKLLQSLRGDFSMWQRLKECTFIRLSLYKSLPSSTGSTYVCCLQFRRSTFSIKFSRTANLEGQAQSDTFTPSMDGTVTLFHISFLVPVLLLRVFELLVSVIQRIAASEAVLFITSSVAVAMSMLTAFIIFVLRKLRLDVRLGLQMS